ncbi:hypothetical protein FKM82_021214 [Ascaphus truei]
MRLEQAEVLLRSNLYCLHWRSSLRQGFQLYKYQVEGDYDIGVYQQPFPQVCPASPTNEETMGMEQECSNEMAGCVSPTSMDAEEDTITLHTVSPNLVPSCSVPEVITASQATNVTSNDADAGIEKHLISFERCEEKMMLLHQDRHEQIMGVHEKLLSEMIQIKDIMKHTNEVLLNHNAFMGSIAQSLKKIVDRDNVQTPVSTSSPPLLGTRQIPLPSQSVLVGQVEDITDITPHPVHTKLPIEVNPSAGVQKDADNGTDRTNIPKFDPWQTATEAIVECPQQLFNDDFQQERLVQ